MYDTTKPYTKIIEKHISSTWDTPYVTVKHTGAYPIIKRKFDKFEVDHTDGIGTKGVHHWRNRSFEHAVLDSLAMNLNDLATMGATAYKLQNHLIMCQDDHRAIEEIIMYLCAECQKRKIAVTGGETSIQNNIVGMDLSLTVSAFLEPRRNEFKAGDVLLGLPSSGLHSNGFTLANKFIPDNWLVTLTMPTTIYYETIHDMLQRGYNLSGMLHIAGGGWTRLVSKLSGTEAILDLGKEVPSVFVELAKAIPSEVMYKTFNCGIGYVIATDNDTSEKILDHYDRVRVIGNVVAGNNKVRITSSLHPSTEVFYR